MNTMDTICKRKSVRTYTGEQITEEQLNTILKAANAAPVGMGRYEDVHLTVIKSADLLAKIDAAGTAMLGKPDAHALYGAPLLIVVSSKMPPVKMMENVVYSNAAIIVQNMALAATELGVGACHIWGATTALANSPDLCRELALPEGFTPCCAVALGKTEYVYEQREIPMDRIAKNVII